MKKVLKFLGWLVIPYIMLVIFWKRLQKPGRIAGVIYSVIIIISAAVNGNSTGNVDKSTSVATSSSPSTGSNTTSESATSDVSVVTNKQSVEQAKKDQAADEAKAANKKKADEEDAAAKKAAEETPKQKILNAIKTLIDSKQAFDSGDYIQGDIPAGEYAFIPFQGSGNYYSEKDAANNIIDNEIFDSFGYVYVHASGNIENQGLLINTSAFPQLGVSGAKQIYEILNDTQNYKGAGYYKIGTDLPAGKYIIDSQGEGYVADMSGPVGKGEINNNQIFNGRYSVTVSNGQYLKVSHGTISQ